MNIQQLNISDQDLLVTRIPLKTGLAPQTVSSPTHSSSPPTDRDPSPNSSSCHPPAQQRKQFYKWIAGENLGEYTSSAKKWKEHTSTAQFTDAFQQIMTKYDDDNDMRAQQIEDFLINEAVEIGILSSHNINTSRNPNKWEK